MAYGNRNYCVDQKQSASGQPVFQLSCLKMSVLKKANALKDEVCFTFYRLAKGIAGILEGAAVRIRGWFKVKHQNTNTGSLRFMN